MAWIKAAFLTALFGTLVTSVSSEAWAASRADSCRRGDRLQIQDLDMTPDPVIEGQRVRTWKVRLNFEGRRECNTEVYVREGNNIVGRAVNYRLRPGVNDIEVPALDAFRFKGREFCLNVQVDLDGSRQQVDAERRFCARARTVWTMREPDDRSAKR